MTAPGVMPRDGGGMTPEQRQAWREQQAKRHRAAPTRPRPKRDQPAPVVDPAAHGQALAARCLRNAQTTREVTR